MKNYRLLITVGIVLMMVLAFYSMVTGAAQEAENFQALVAEARNFKEQKLYQKASEKYQEVIAIDNEISYYLEVIDMYYDAELTDACLAWCEMALENFKNDSRGYDRIIRTCLKIEDYDAAYAKLDEADGRGCVSGAIEQLRAEMMYLIKEDVFTGSAVRQFSGGFAGFQKKDMWGFVNAKGKTAVSAKHKDVGYMANEIAAVWAEDDNWYFMDSVGDFTHNISLNIPGEITAVGLYNYEVYPVCVDGSYKYYDLTFKLRFGDYKFAGSFNQGVAAVKNGNAWSLIGPTGEPIVGETFEDVVLDERGMCCAGERILVKKDGKYIMLDTAGQRVGSETFEDAVMFAAPYGAVCKNGKWGYVDNTGTFVIEPQYLEAKSFGCGLGAVKTADGWGYINEKNEMCIPAKYVSATTFNSNGTAFVDEMDGWTVISLYRLNHKSGL